MRLSLRGLLFAAFTILLIWVSAPVEVRLPAAAFAIVLMAGVFLLLQLRLRWRAGRPEAWEAANLRALRAAEARAPKGAIVGQVVARYEIEARAEFRRRLEPYQGQVEVLEATWRSPQSRKQFLLTILLAVIHPVIALNPLSGRYGALTVIVRPLQAEDRDWWSH